MVMLPRIVQHLCLLALVVVSSVSAWGRSGHEEVARLAKGLLSSHNLNEIGKIIDGDMVKLARWEETITMRYPETDTLHYHHQEPEMTCIGEVMGVHNGSPPYLRKGADSDDVNESEDSDNYNYEDDDWEKEFNSAMHAFQPKDGTATITCDEKNSDEVGSLFCGFMYFFKHFAHDALLKEFPEPEKPLNVPKSLKVLKKVKRKDLTAREYLRWLIILIGDLHQPLHLFQYHEYGHDIDVHWKGNYYSLHEFWENVIPRHIQSKKLMPQMNKTQYYERAASWQDRSPLDLFREWTTENAKHVCEKIYGPLEECRLKKDEDSSGATTTYVMTDKLFKHWVAAAREKLVLGGQRVAFLLNDILAHSKHKHAMQKEGRAKWHHRRSLNHIGSNFIFNLGVAAVLVPALLVLLHWHDKAGGPLPSDIYSERRNKMKYYA